jgi:hypothetical protein
MGVPLSVDIRQTNDNSENNEQSFDRKSHENLFKALKTIGESDISKWVSI